MLTPKEPVYRIKIKNLTLFCHILVTTLLPGHHYLDFDITNWFCHSFKDYINGITQNNFLYVWHLLLNIILCKFFCFLILRNIVGSWVSNEIIEWDNTLQALKCLAFVMLAWLTVHLSSLRYFMGLRKKLVAFNYYWLFQSHNFHVHIWQWFIQDNSFVS